ncbi:MAG: alpha/beta hydrolase [Promethearchaeota archaeon]
MVINQIYQKTSKVIARKYARLSFSLLFCMLLWYFAAFMVNFIGYDDLIFQNLLMKSLNFVLFWFINILIGIYIYSGLIQFNLKNQEINNSKSQLQTSSLRKKFHNAITILHWVIVVSGFVLLIYVDIGIFVPGTSMPRLFGIGIVAGMLGTFFGLIGFTLTAISMVAIIHSTYLEISTSSKIFNHMQQFIISKKNPLIISVFTLGLMISSIGFIPLVSTPAFIKSTRMEFERAFNPEFAGDWQGSIDPSIKAQYFRSSPFILSEYFWGPSTYDCITFKDILYFNGSESAYPQDKDITLYFDAFLPPNRGIGLPGQNSTLIRIHGGGWVVGDKGFMNVNEMNRYFASQGYCVFDIQYGLNNVSDLFKNLPHPEHVMGNFSIDDIMRHIGNFTKYLKIHASEFGANLGSTFVSGGSAGGQLTCAAALSLAHKNYSEFSKAYTIKGLIPYYPANNPQHEFSISSRPEWVDPNLLVNASSPPCLIFQGDKDPLLPKAIQFQHTYFDYGRDDCGLLIFPFAGHASDMYFPGYYNQVFLYYMERFLYLFH